MNLLCPECRRDLVVRDGTSAVCPGHGGSYRILYRRPLATVPREKPVRSELLPGEACLQHPGVPAVRLCAECGQPMCETCTFELPGGRVCPRCASQGRPPLSAAPVVPAGVMCAAHPSVPATQWCEACRAPICATCDFAYDGGLHLCPACATNPRPTVSRGRLANAIISLLLAALASAALFGMLLDGGSSRNSERDALGAVFGTLVLVLSVAGTALALASRDRRSAHSPLVSVGLVWNGVVLGVALLLAVIGTFLKGH